MKNWYDGYINPHHFPDLSTPGTSCINDVFTPDCALWCKHRPLTASRTLNPQSRTLSKYSCTTSTGCPCKCMCCLTWVNVTIIRLVNTANQSMNFGQRVKFLNLFWGNNVKIVPDKPSQSLNMPKLIHAISQPGNTHCTSLMKPDIHARVCCQRRLVKANAFSSHLHNAHIVCEVRAKSCCVPCRSVG